ncbi:MAG: nitroreductase family protein [Armatimonadetes bacterium]|nr:nitroreductase family protein [Armatimonadota bacterium]
MREKIDFILKRHSCRHFFNQKLKEGDLELLIQAAIQAPSAGNCQPWFMYAVENETLKMNLAVSAYQQMFLKEGSVIFVVCVDSAVSASKYGSRGRALYALQDTAALIENLLLAATCLGYGSCWVGSFNEEEVRAVLKIPKNFRPIALVPIGPGKLEAEHPRKNQNDIVKIIK